MLEMPIVMVFCMVIITNLTKLEQDKWSQSIQSGIIYHYGYKMENQIQMMPNLNCNTNTQFERSSEHLNCTYHKRKYPLVF